MPVMEVMGVMPGFKRTKNRVFFIIAVFARITGLKSMFKAEIYSEPCQTSKVERFSKRVNG